MPPAKKPTPEKAAKKSAVKRAPSKPITKSAPKKSATAKKKAPSKKAPPEKTAARGRALAEIVIARLAGPGSPIGEPIPLDAAQRAACEEAMGVALSPFMDALFSYDIGWLARETSLFDDDGRAIVESSIETIGDHAGVFAECYEPWCEGRLHGKTAQLEAGSDSMRFLYLGAPDEHGEYPVLNIDHDDCPLLEVRCGGFDIWVAEALGIEVEGASRAAKASSKRLLGAPQGWEMGPDDYPSFDALPPIDAPKPGSVKHEPLAPPIPREGAQSGKGRKLTPAQIAKALKESANAGRVERLHQLIAEARERGLPQKALDDALVGACLGKQGPAMRALLDAGASPNARDHYGGALSRLITYGGDVDLARMLLDAGASADSPGVNGETAIFEAVERGDEAIAKLLIERGANVNHKAENELVPLHEAVRGQPNPRFVDILCEAGADPNICKKQSPPLIWAAQEASAEHVQRLLAHGARVDCRASYLAETPLHAAFSRGRDDIAQVLVRAGADRASKDARGISLTRVYGPDGRDARAVSLRYAPSAEPQDLQISVELAVTNHYQAPHALLPALDGGHWEALARAGAAGEGQFPPSVARVDTLRALDKAPLGKPGFHELDISLRVAGLSAGFVRWMILTALGGARALTGAGAEAIVRVTALDAKGTLDAAPMDLEALRAWAAQSPLPAVSQSPLPFELTARAGPTTEIIVTLDDPKRKPEPMIDALNRAMTAWTFLLERVPRLPDGPAPFFLMAFPQPPKEGRVHIQCMNPAAQKRDKALRLPWPAESLLPQLGEVMRAAHEKVGIAKVELVMGG